MATNSSRADILRMRLKSLYDALHELPSTIPVAELAGLTQVTLLRVEIVHRIRTYVRFLVKVSTTLV